MCVAGVVLNIKAYSKFISIVHKALNIICVVQMNILLCIIRPNQHYCNRSANGNCFMQIRLFCHY